MIDTLSIPTDYITTLVIVPYTSSFVKQYDLDNDNKTINGMFAKLIDKFDKQDENMKSIFSKQDSEINNKIETQLQHLTLQVKDN